MRFVVGIVLVLTLPGPVAAQDSPYDLPIREHVYPNGLRLLVLERPGDSRVAAKIFTDMGALNEVPGMLGAAHFLEHLMFKGTRTLGTTNWEAEAPLHAVIASTEGSLVEELNLARNTLRQRGTFHDYAHAESTRRADSLRAELAALDSAVARYRDNGATMRWYQAYGGTELTASTEQEYMKFDINLPRSRVALFFRIEADRMANAVFREFEQERMIVLEQRYGDLNRPTTPYYEQMNAAVGLVHPVFWPEGYLTDFDQYTRAYERELYDTYFVPNNTTIVLVGGVSFDAMVPLVAQYFGDMQRAPEPTRVRAVEPVPQAERRVIYRSTTLAPRVEARFGIPGVGHPDRPLFDVLLGVASRSIETALAQQGIAARVDGNTRVVHTSRFGVPASMNLEVISDREEDLPRIEATLLATLAALAEAPPPAEQVALVQKHLQIDWHRLSLDAGRLAFEIGHFQTMDSWQTLQPYLEARDRAKPEDLQRLAQEYFVPENRTIGVVRSPEHPSPDSTSQGAR
jgi:predicted Zn-dependent peptidase